ncbi:hypothetical protein AAC387_Pa04g1074 [Persea americana]
MDMKKLLLQSWSPGQDGDSWPAITPVWIRLKGVPYHCWSSDILLSIAGSIGKPLCLVETTATQRMLSFAHFLVNLDIKMLGPRLLTVELEGVTAVEVEVRYENVPCSECFSAGHLSGKFPFIVKPALLKTPPIALQLHPQIVSVTSTDIVPDESSLPV